MILQIEHNAPEPIYEQLVAEIEKMILAGSLSANDPLPSIRQLSSQLDVAVNTVARAYQELERKGLIVCNGRKGSFVRRSSYQRSHSRDMKELILEMIRNGWDRKEIERAFSESLDQIFN